MKRARSNKLVDEKQNQQRDKRKETVEEEEEKEEEDSGRESEYDLPLEGAGERDFGRDSECEGGKKDEEGEDEKSGKPKEEEKDKEEEEQEEKEAWENNDPVPDLDIEDHSLEEKESPLVESGQRNILPKHGWTKNIETSSELSSAKESQQSYSEQVIHVSYWTHGL